MKSQIGSAFENKINDFYFLHEQTRSSKPAKPAEKVKPADKWSFLVPWDDNSSLNASLRLQEEFRGEFKAVICSSRIAGQPIGILFPVRGAPDKIMAKMGMVFTSFRITGNLIRKTIDGIKPISAMYTFRIVFYNRGEVIGEADALPNITIDPLSNTMDYYGFRATPAVGSRWISTTKGGYITVTRADADMCIDGFYAPWSRNTPRAMEYAMLKLQT